MLNAVKSDVMLIGTSAQLCAADHISKIVVTGANLKPVAVIKSLGVFLGSLLTFAAPVTAVRKACNYHIMGLTTHTPSFNTQCRQHISMQHRWSTH